MRLLLTLALVGSLAQAQRPTGTIIVSNMSDNTATIIDAANGRVVATVATGEGPHEVATSLDGRWAIVTNYGVRGKPGSSITVIDVERAAVARTIDVSPHQRPHGAAFLPGDTTLAVTSEVSGAILLVDFRTGAVIGTLPTKGRGSHMLAVSANGDRVVNGNISDGTITVTPLIPPADPKSIRVAAQPEGVAITPDGNFAWVGSNRDSVVLVVDTRTGVASDTLRGFGLPYRLAITPDGRRAIVSDPVNATIHIFDAATRKERASIAVPRDSLLSTTEVPGSPSPEGVAVSRDSRWAFVTLQGRNRVVTVDLERGSIVASAPTGNWSDGVAFSPRPPRSP